MTDIVLTRHAEALALLADPSYTVVTAPAGNATRGVAWLRAHVSRFATGAVHARRRLLVEQLLATLDPDRLRHRAYELSTTDPQRDPGAVTVTVLAEALGISADVAPLVAAIAPAYFPGSAVPEAADDAVDALVSVLGGRYDEESAARVGILVQAHDATAGLVATTLAAGTPPLGETLRDDPPVPYLWRVGPDGSRVGIDVRAANQDGMPPLSFGAGPRACPGSEHALAIAAGIVGDVPT